MLMKSIKDKISEILKEICQQYVLPDGGTKDKNNLQFVNATPFPIVSTNQVKAVASSQQHINLLPYCYPQ